MSITFVSDRNWVQSIPRKLFYGVIEIGDVGGSCLMLLATPVLKLFASRLCDYAWSTFTPAIEVRVFAKFGVLDSLLIYFMSALDSFLFLKSLSAHGSCLDIYKSLMTCDSR